MNRGDVWWVDFGQPFGSEPGYRRPVIVMQAEPFNRSRIDTVIVVPMTTNTELAAVLGTSSAVRNKLGFGRPRWRTYRSWRSSTGGAFKKRLARFRLNS